MAENYPLGELGSGRMLVIDRLLECELNSSSLPVGLRNFLKIFLDIPFVLTGDKKNSEKEDE